MKMKNGYIAPQMIVVGLDASDIVTTSYDEEDNWRPDIFGEEGEIINR